MQPNHLRTSSVTLVDSHCHLDQLEILPAVAISRAETHGVNYFLNVCIDLEHFPQVLKAAEPYKNVAVTVGLHPNEIVTKEPTVDELVKLARQHSKVIGIGETGLDYYRSKGELDWQRERFRCHVQAAKQLNLPLIVHSRQARQDTIKILAEQNAATVGGIMHCFTEDWAMAQQALNLNFYISFSGIVTFKNALEIKEVAKKIPLDRMLLETDSPYLAPVPYRGKPNEPAYVHYVAEHIAELRNEPFEKIAQQTTENFFRLFKL